MEKKREYIIHSPDEIDSVAGKVISALGNNRILAFYGEMGAGKTTFIKALCKQLGSTDNVLSPTFTLVNEYRTGEGEPIYHFDFYRIERIEEVLDFGIDEYFESGYHCFMEWPGKIESLLPGETLPIIITEGTNNSRTVTISW